MTEMLLLCYKFMTNAPHAGLHKNFKQASFFRNEPSPRCAEAKEVHMERESGINVIEKQRLRDSIADQVKRFLESGGSITVLDREGIQSAGTRHRSSGWHANNDNIPLLD